MAAAPVLEFERPIAELEKQIEELKRLASDQSIDVAREIAPLEKKLGEVRVQIYQNLTPLQRVQGTVRLPGSKSISNRVLLLAGLSAGTTRVHDLLDSDDTRVMLDALRTLGCGIERHGSGEGAPLSVTGLSGRLTVHEASLFLGNAGTAMRPLAAALAVLSATQGGCFELSGVARMHERPIGDLSHPR